MLEVSRDECVSLLTCSAEINTELTRKFFMTEMTLEERDAERVMT